MCLWYLCFILFVCCSYKGRQAVLYCLSQCFPNLNPTLVDRMLQRQRRQWTLNFWHAARARHMTGWNGETNTNTNTNDANEMADISTQEQPKALALKTKSYEPPPSDVEAAGSDDDDDDDHCCTICFAPLEAGDRVGNLPCNHMFHVDCLKSWVQRKNACPLCACPLATETNKRPHASIIHTTSTPTTASSSSSSRSTSTSTNSPISTTAASDNNTAVGSEDEHV
jgi:hypothetical protein